MAALKVGIVMGSQSDWPVMEHAVKQLEAFGVAYEARVVSAHRTPDLLFDYAASAREKGLACIIAGAGGAAHLPGMLAAKSTVPVLGVPVPSKYLKGMDSLLFIVSQYRKCPGVCLWPLLLSAKRVQLMRRFTRFHCLQLLTARWPPGLMIFVSSNSKMCWR